MDRMRYMECLVKHHVPDVGLDTDSLRRACSALLVPTPESQGMHDSQVTESTRPKIAETAETAESPGIQDEDCTIDDVDGSIARMSMLSVVSPLRT